MRPGSTVTRQPFCAPPTDLQAVLHQMSGQVRRWNKHHFIYLNQAPEPKLYYVRSGLVRLGSYTEDGREITLCLLGEGTLFGDFCPQPGRHEFAQAFTPVELGSYSSWHIQQLLEQDTAVVWQLLSQIEAQWHRMGDQFRIFHHEQARQRLLYLIYYLAEEYGYRQQGITYIPHSFTHADLARLIHLSRQTVTTLLSGLQRRGYLTYRRGLMCVYQLEELLQSTP